MGSRAAYSSGMISRVQFVLGVASSLAAPKPEPSSKPHVHGSNGITPYPLVFKEPSLIYPTTLVFRPDGTLSCAWMGDREREWFEAERKFALS